MPLTDEAAFFAAPSPPLESPFFDPPGTAFEQAAVQADAPPIIRLPPVEEPLAYIGEPAPRFRVLWDRAKHHVASDYGNYLTQLLKERAGLR